ncbi:MAG: preprotein translocase subunit SecA [Chlamydiia bacterium]|nr:preprotein translocase subunit SecA [Chlamydiia bacterium]
MFGILKKIFGSSQERRLKQYANIVSKVNEWDEHFSPLSDEELRGKTEEFKKRYQEGESLTVLLPEAYGVIKQVCRRMVGQEVHVSGYDQKWDMIPYDVQILGAVAMQEGTIAEMQTGEGKTLTATMPLYLNALSGKPVHLVTVNDYLAGRDCSWVGSILRWLGLTTGVLTNETPGHQRRSIYQCDVVYGTASEFGFDYLRDNSMSVTKEDQVQRGFFFAIVDEIDSILIDEARTPLIISGPTPQSRQMYGELKGEVSSLVKQQRDLCNRVASEGWKFLDRFAQSDKELSSLSKEETAQIKEGCHKLWIVSKGTPHNKALRRARENPDLRSEIDKWDLFYTSDQNKQEKAKALSELYMTIDEKGNEFELTDRGIKKWSEYSGGSPQDFVMLDLGYEFALIDQNARLSEEEKIEKKVTLSEEDAQRKERSHNIRQLLRAHLLMEKDVDYIIVDDKIVIIDENTGRPQPGRRFSDGLHQAIEAKENVAIQKETQTYATITLQNYFRLYDKLAGMTGTAITEANEFKEIYKLEVLQIPTYKPCIRTDANDEVYMTEREKYHALVKEIQEVHQQGRPILLGTESVEVSEKLSRILRQNRIDHTVLNAKHHRQEAEIIAKAGKRGAVTVSTNMAGRGTDIKLGEEVAKIGGLHVIGTTRHQSRRIDRQLRGRSARLGDPGSSKFFISFEDELLRLFASPRITAMLKRFRPPEGEAISAGILNRSIETAQKRVEGRNYTVRKYTLEYDDVMNKQRQEIYGFRNEILHSKNLIPTAKDLLFHVCEIGAHDFLINRSQTGGWNPNGYREWLMTHFPILIKEDAFDDDHAQIEEIIDKSFRKIEEAFEQKLYVLTSRIKADDPNIDTERLKQDAIRSIMIQKIDELWQDHLLTMDYLRSEVNLRAVAQKDPLLEFKHEAFRLFHELSKRLHLEAARTLFRIEVRRQDQRILDEMLTQINLETDRMIFNDHEPSVFDALPRDDKNTPIVAAPKTGRNDPCPCNSGKKYKRCCGLLQPEES